VEGCLACDVISGSVVAPGGRILETDQWVVDHCVGSLGVGTLIVKPYRHVLHVGDLNDDEARELGERLRIVRRQREMSLEQVELTSAQEFKAAVLGAYERGERAISVARLRRLARFYGVPIDYLLSDHTDAAEPGRALLGRAEPSFERLVVDLRRMQSPTGPEDEKLRRYVRMIQLQRGDFNGRVLTLRGEDRRARSEIQRDVAS